MEDLKTNKNEAKDEEIVYDEKTNFISFVVGVRGTQEFQAQTNLDPCTVNDYTEASAGIDVNIMLAILRNSDIKSVETFLKMKEIITLASVKAMANYYDKLGLTKEQYSQLRGLFHIDELEESLEESKKERRAAILNVTKEDEK